MSYYADFFLRPKQAIAYSYDHPSLLRSLAFVVLGGLVGVLAGLVFAGQLFLDIILTTLAGDILRWLAGGFLFAILAALVKKAPLSMDFLSRALSLLAHLNVYGFFLFLVVGILLPAVAIPGLLQASQQLNQGIIGEEEFNLALSESISDISSNALLALPLILFAFLLILYSMYSLYLASLKFFNTTAFKAILISLAWILVQSVLVLTLNSIL